MKDGLRYLPAYVGLYLSLLLGMSCNAFLDIKYGVFGSEVLIWAVIFALTLRVGWRQQGEVTDAAKKTQNYLLLLSLVLAALVFFPIWGLPRAGVYTLGMFQAAYNCTTSTRRHLYMGLLVSLVMVMFATVHARADWTMLFYLLPYLVAVVYTMVSEQVGQRMESAQHSALGRPSLGGQGAAIVAATSVILLLGSLLYALTPQPTYPYLESRFGQPSTLGHLGTQEGQGGGSGSGEFSGGSGVGEGSGSGAGAGLGASEGYGRETGGWPTPQELREAANRPGMPDWQAGTMLQMADLSEALSEMLAPVMQQCGDWWEALKAWIREHLNEILIAVMIMIVLALLLAFYTLMKEAKAGVWLRTRLDYLKYGLLGWHDKPERQARAYYEAMERLFRLDDASRPREANTEEYARVLARYYQDSTNDVRSLTRLFETARYGTRQLTEEELKLMRLRYKALYSQR